MTSKIIYVILGAFLSVHLLSALYYYVTIAQFGTLQEMALFGDSFGALNSFFSGLALAGVVYSLLLQRQDLQATLQEMKDSTKVAESSSKLLEDQLISMDRNNTIGILKQKLADNDFLNEDDKIYSKLIIDELTQEILTESRYQSAFKPVIGLHSTNQLFQFPPDAYYLTFGLKINIPAHIIVENTKKDQNLTFELFGDENGAEITVDSKSKYFLMKLRSTQSLAFLDFIVKPLKSNMKWRQALIISFEKNENNVPDYRIVFSDPISIEG